MIQTYPNHPGHKGPAETGRQAANSVAAKAAKQRQEILKTFEAGDFTPDECAALMRPRGMGDVEFETFKRGIRSRCSELKGKDFLTDTKKRKLNSSGSNAVVLGLVRKPVETFAPGYPQQTFRRMAGNETTTRCIQQTLL